MGLGKLATDAKKRFTAVLESLGANSAHESSERAEKIKRGYARGSRGTAKLGGAFDTLEFREGPSNKTKKKHELSSAEIMQIINAVKVDKLSQHEVAVKFCVSARLVSSLVAAVTKDPEFVKRTLDRENKRRQKLRAVLDLSLQKLSDSAAVFKA